jgi:hypothetical protein
VFYYQLMEVSDYRNDVILAEACRNDVEKYCKDVEPGEGPEGCVCVCGLGGGGGRGQGRRGVGQGQRKGEGGGVE